MFDVQAIESLFSLLVPLLFGAGAVATGLATNPVSYTHLTLPTTPYV